MSHLSRIHIDPTGKMTVLDLWNELTPLTTPQKVRPTFQGTTFTVTQTHGRRCRATPLAVQQVGWHHGEEPYVQGPGGAATVYFAHCPLRCPDCTLRDLPGAWWSAAQLFDALADKVRAGATSINLVSPMLYTRALLPLLQRLRRSFVGVPIIYNGSGYETRDTLRTLAPYIDIWVPDLKAVTAHGISKRRLPLDYARRFLSNLAWLLERTPLTFTAPSHTSLLPNAHRRLQTGRTLRRGVVVRHLLFGDDPKQPNHCRGTELRALLDTLQPYRKQLIINLMTAYHQSGRVADFNATARAHAAGPNISINGEVLA